MMLIQKPQPKYVTPVKGIYSVTVTDVRRMPAKNDNDIRTHLRIFLKIDGYDDGVVPWNLFGDEGYSTGSRWYAQQGLNDLAYACGVTEIDNPSNPVELIGRKCIAEINTMKNGGNCYTVVKPLGGDDALR